MAEVRRGSPFGRGDVTRAEAVASDAAASVVEVSDAEVSDSVESGTPALFQRLPVSTRGTSPRGGTDAPARCDCAAQASVSLSTPGGIQRHRPGAPGLITVFHDAGVSPTKPWCTGQPRPPLATVVGPPSDHARTWWN